MTNPNPDGAIGRVNFCPACGSRIQTDGGNNKIVAASGKSAQPVSATSGLAKIFRSDIGLSVLAYTGLGGWIGSLLPFVDVSTGLVTGAAIGLFRKI